MALKFKIRYFVILLVVFTGIYGGDKYLDYIHLEELRKSGKIYRHMIDDLPIEFGNEFASSFIKTYDKKGKEQAYIFANIENLKYSLRYHSYYLAQSSDHAVLNYVAVIARMYQAVYEKSPKDCFIQFMLSGNLDFVPKEVLVDFKAALRMVIQDYDVNLTREFLTQGQFDIMEKNNILSGKNSSAYKLQNILDRNFKDYLRLRKEYGDSYSISEIMEEFHDELLYVDDADMEKGCFYMKDHYLRVNQLKPPEKINYILYRAKDFTIEFLRKQIKEKAESH